jgi:hypothetical protein
MHSIADSGHSLSQEERGDSRASSPRAQLDANEPLMQSSSPQGYALMRAME